MKPDPEIMRMLITLAADNHQNGGHAVAAAIVREGKVIATGVTTIIRDNDPTAHAEINAIRAAGNAIANRFLNSCYLYTTYEPCPMCTSAAIWAKLQGIIYGADMTDQTTQCPQRIAISAKLIAERGTPRLEIVPHLLREDCLPLLHLQA
jgi:tRNA(adenine34) deaminase